MPGIEMLSHEDVVRLHQELGEEKALSVYLNAEETNPAERRAWRIRLNGMLKAMEDELADRPSAERAAARAAVELIEAELADYTGLLPQRGWVAFATADRLWHAAPTPAPMPDLVRWEAGAHVSPYIRALKQSRPVTAVVADRRHARIYQYLHGDLREMIVLQSDAAVTDTPPPAGAPNRSPARSGVRGVSRADAAQRTEDVSAQRLLREVSDALSQPATAGHLLVIAGHAETSGAILRGLSERIRERAIEVPEINADATTAELKEAIDGAASTLSNRLQQGLVEEVLNTTRAGGRACLGREPTERALEAGAVDTLLISRNYLRSEPDVAEWLVDRALEQGAAVEEIAEEVATELDHEGGIGARLRFAA